MELVRRGTRLARRHRDGSRQNSFLRRSRPQRAKSGKGRGWLKSGFAASRVYGHEPAGRQEAFDRSCEWIRSRGRVRDCIELVKMNSNSLSSFPVKAYVDSATL